MPPKRKIDLQREIKQLRGDLDEARQALQQRDIRTTQLESDGSSDDEVVIASPHDHDRYHVSMQLPHQDLFDGSRSWESFFSAFKNIASACRWDSRERRFRLLASLRGDAADFAYQQLPEEIVNEYDKLAEALAERFGNRKTAASFVSQLEARRLGPKESISEFAAEIKRLTTFGYPTADSATLDMIAMRHFLRGLGDHNMTLTIGMQEPRTLQEAREIAERYLNLREEAVRRPVRSVSASTSNAETLISEERLNSFEKRVMDVIEKRLSDILAKQSEAQPSPRPTGYRQRRGGGSGGRQRIRCYSCNGEGHIARWCPFQQRSFQSQSQSQAEAFQQHPAEFQHQYPPWVPNQPSGTSPPWQQQPPPPPTQQSTQQWPPTGPTSQPAQQGGGHDSGN